LGISLDSPQGCTRSLFSTNYETLLRGGHIIYETGITPTLLRSYTWGSGTDDLVAIFDHQAGQRYYVVQDELRSYRGLVRRDAAGGTWLMAYRYSAYGEGLTGEGPGPGFTIRFWWAGAQMDLETGLYFLRTRYYDPTFGRFTQEDAAGYGGGGNLYAYAGGNPTERRDPDGMRSDIEPQYHSDQELHTALDPFAGASHEDLTNWMDELETLSALHDLLGLTHDAYLRAYELRRAAGTFVGGMFDSSSPLSSAQFEAVKDAIVTISDRSSDALSLGDNARAVGGLAGMLRSGRIVSMWGTLAGVGEWNHGDRRIGLFEPAFANGSDYTAFVLAHEYGHVVSPTRGEVSNHVQEMWADHFALRATGMRAYCYPYSNCSEYHP
jgi:RHS repeat-associated protein